MHIRISSYAQLRLKHIFVWFAHVKLEAILRNSKLINVSSFMTVNNRRWTVSFWLENVKHPIVAAEQSSPAVIGR